MYIPTLHFTYRKLDYCEAFVNEVLRSFPGVGHLERVCVSDYYIPEIDFTVPKGMLVQLANAMEDEKYFENPLVIITKNIVLTYICM